MKMIPIPLLLLCTFSFANTPLLLTDTAYISDYVGALGGKIEVGVFELGADSKIYGDVSVSKSCFLRERAQIGGTLAFAESCRKQNNIKIGKEIFEKQTLPTQNMPAFQIGSQNIFVPIGADFILEQGAYAELKVDARSKINFKAGTYTFSKIHSEPDAVWNFDLSNGKIKIFVQNGVRIADRNKMQIVGGNPSEIEWNIAEGSVDLGTDGKFFGKYTAPNSNFRIAPRSHLVGSVATRRFSIEPRATISLEPRAEEISHSEYHFAPFYEEDNFRYKSVIPISKDSVEMFVYADSLNVKINGYENSKVSLPAKTQDIAVSLERQAINDFPAEAFKSVYKFEFSKDNANRVYWNPSSPCVESCDGTTEQKAVKNFSEAKSIAEQNGFEIKMLGGVWEISESEMQFPVGLEIVGTEKPFWELSSFSDIPAIDLKNKGSIKLKGKSPRKILGLNIKNGLDSANGGALQANSESLELHSMAFTNSKSKDEGGAVWHGGKEFIGKNLLFENNSASQNGGAISIMGTASIDGLACSENSSNSNGGCISALGNVQLTNAVFYGNNVKNSGGAIFVKNANVQLQNGTFADNKADVSYPAIAGGSGEVYNSVFWNNTAKNCSRSWCSVEIPSSWTANYSSFSASRKGTGNIFGDPKFNDINKPAGLVHFYGYDAGLIIADKSPALKGNKIDETPELDLVGTERGNDIAMGAYANYNNDGSAFQYGEWILGNFEPRPNTRQPLFTNLPNQYIIDYVGYGGYGRVIKHLVRKHSKTKISKATVRITVLDSNFKAYPDIKPVDVIFYRTNEEENGKYVFQSLTNWPLYSDYDTEKHGRIILFSMDHDDQGIHENFLVIHAKNIKDNFRYEVVKW